jgi:hypothetical protein
MLKQESVLLVLLFVYLEFLFNGGQKHKRGLHFQAVRVITWQYLRLLMKFVFIYHLLNDMVLKVENLITVRCDNVRAIFMAENSCNFDFTIYNNSNWHFKLDFVELMFDV